MQKGDFVLLRTYSAGVHFGEFQSKSLVSGGTYEVHLKNARRLWSWSGALSLSEVAMKGIKINDSKISVPVDEIYLPGVIEIIPVSKNSNLPGNAESRKGVSAEV
jgi:hypothetical protein